MKEDKIPFHQTARGSKEEEYIAAALAGGNLSSDGPFSKRCEKWLEEKTGCLKAFLTPSASSALEMAAILAEIAPGDEIILPSYTFPSTANAFLLRGAVPVFVDMREGNLCMDEALIKEAITDKTRAVVPVHYGGFSADMEKINSIADEQGLTVIEDAAQALLSSYKGKPLGSFGKISCISFHDTKNIGCGEGGALLINNEALIERAEVIRNFGTNRAAFMRGETDHYHWMSSGTSCMMGELAAACLMARLEEADEITSRRVEAWNYYFEGLEAGEREGFFLRPHIDPACGHNGHIFPIILEKSERRDRLMNYLSDSLIDAKTHYMPLHETLFGRQSARNGSRLDVTSRINRSLVRLPLWDGIERTKQDIVIGRILHFFGHD